MCTGTTFVHGHIFKIWHELAWKYYGSCTRLQKNATHIKLLPDLARRVIISTLVALQPYVFNNKYSKIYISFE